jgi:hypothetical protein
VPGTRRTTIASLVFAIAAGASSLGAALFVAPAPASAEVLAEATAIFAGPGYSYPSVAGAGSGEWLSVDGEAVDGWVPVTYYGISGWVEQSAIEPGSEWVPAPEGYYDAIGEDAASGGDDASASDGTITGGDTASDGSESAAAGSGGPEAVSDEAVTSDPSQVESNSSGQDGQDYNARGERRNREGDNAGSGSDGTTSGSTTGAVSEPTGDHDLAAPDGQSTSHEADSEYTDEQILGYIFEAADKYGQDRVAMERVARCESGLNPYAVDSAGLYYGLFQFIPETFATTPYAEYDIFDPWANSMAAAWMWSEGMKNHWTCQ